MEKIYGRKVWQALDRDGMFVQEPGMYRWELADATAAAYSFSNTAPLAVRRFGLLLRSRKDVVIDGHGSAWVFHGHMTPIGIDDCENVTVRNLTIDFDPPLVAEGEVVARGETYVDVHIDTKEFPCEAREGWLYFDIGEEELSPLTHRAQIRFDPDGTVSFGSGDDFVPERIEQIGEEMFRMYPKRLPAGPVPGDRFVLRHNERLHPGIFAQGSRNIMLENITVHSCGGLGVLAQFCENVTLRNVRFTPNRERGRYVCSGRDDGLQAASCRGLVVCENCLFEGLMDDPVNVHGCSMQVEHIGGTHLTARYMHPDAHDFDAWARPGDRIALIDRRSMAPIGEYRAERCRKCSKDTVELTLDRGIEADTDALAIENLSNTPDVILRGNVFGSCRARGVLLTTPGKVLVEGNTFASSGSGILISGDANYWYESGACRDVTIRNNVFTEKTMSSMYQFCNAMISVCPVIPEPDVYKPFHCNIVIEGNEFRTPDVPVLYAFSVNGLRFAGNRIAFTGERKNCTGGTELIRLEYCRDARIGPNTLAGETSLGPCSQKECENVILADQETIRK